MDRSIHIRVTAPLDRLRERMLKQRPKGVAVAQMHEALRA